MATTRVSRAPHPLRAPLLRYGIAILSTLLAVLLREALTPLWGDHHLPFLTLFPAVVLSAWYGGLGPGLLTTSLCAVAAIYFWLSPSNSLATSDLGDWVGLALAVVVMLLITWLTALLRWTQATLEDRLQERTAELTQANTMLANERARLLTTLEQLPIGVIIADVSSEDRLMTNTQAKQIWRYEALPNTVSGFDRYQGFSLDGQPYRIEDWPLQRALRMGEVTTNEEIVFVRGDGTRGVMQASAAPIRTADGRVTAAVVTILDITAHKQMEEELRALNVELDQRVQERTTALHESEARFAAAFASSPIVLTIVSLSEARLIDVNARFTHLLGYTRDEVIGRTIDEVGFWSDPIQCQELFAHLRTKGRMPETEVRFRHKNGQECLGVLGSTLVQINGRTCVLCGVVDITARKRAEETLAQQARDLARAHADLRQVAYVSAHDLQEPIRQVGIYTQKMAKCYGESTDAELREASAFIIEGTKRMQAQLTDLMHYLEMEEPGDARTTTDCGTVLHRALDALRHSIATSGATITHDPLPTLEANAKHLQLLFQELIDNAVKFRKSTAPQVHVGAEREEDGWRFVVRDNGLGIAPQGIGQLFGFFRRLQSRTDYPGTGMGLAICKKIVDRHGGRIWIESSPGGGTAVYFTICDRERRASGLCDAQHE